MSVVGFVAGSLIALGLYVLPTAIAVVRRSRRAPAVTLLDLLLGWTAVAWVVAFAMAIAPDRRGVGVAEYVLGCLACIVAGVIGVIVNVLWVRFPVPS